MKVSCSGDVDVHSRIHESKDNGVTYAEGSLFPAIVAEPLSSEVRTTPMPSDFIVAEVGGAPARVTGTLTAGKRISDKQWDLPASGERAILVTDVIRAFGPMEANLRATGEGQVIIFSAITDPRSATVARRAPAAVRTAVTAANPPSITRQLGVASFKAAPFQDPLTGLVLMRDRWYDPTSGTFLTPDPEGYRDSSNAYVFCAGDPVNCSDPTGRAASVNTKGDIIGIRPGGSRYFISSAEAKADPVKALRLLESDTDLSFDKQEEIMRRAGLRIPISSACRPSERCLPGPEHSNPNAFTHLPSNGKWAEAAFVGTTGLPSQTREQELVSGGVQIVGVAVPAAAGIRARLRGGVGAGIQPVFGTRAGVPVGVNTFMSEVYGPSSPALLPSGVSPVEQYRSELAMDMGKPIVRDPELARILDKVYRPDATLWSGSTADAVRYERLNGRPVGGRWHTQKAQEAVSTLLI
ncbi:MAG TPA: RHS repeat-associated core domain-containing protein, partial [Thermoanaerobaculia bacterium]